MKKFLTIIILTISLTASPQADEIRDFQIEGMSLGDSLLDFFDKDLIEKEIYENKNTFWYKNKRFVQIGASYKNFYSLNVDSKTYDDLSIVIKPKDTSYKIYAIGGRLLCSTDINICKTKKKNIQLEIKKLFNDGVKITNSDTPHSHDKSGKSKTYSTFYNFKSGAYIELSVYDWSGIMKNSAGMVFPDNTKFMIVSSELRDFLDNVQYK